MDQQTQPQSTPKKEKKTIYDVGYGSIFARNFLAGFSRTIGAIFVYILLGGLIYYMAVTYILPQIQNFLPSLSPLLGPPQYQEQNSQSLESKPPGYTVSQEQLDEALEMLIKQQQEKLSKPTP